TTAVRTIVVQDDVVVNTPPQIVGVSNSELTVGDSFNPLAGVTATDAQDGDLTAKIVVTGSVNTAVAGTYTLTYAVKDTANAETKVNRTVTVKVKSTGVTTWEASKVYNTGNKVLFNGTEYTAKWWTQGEEPGKAAVWQAKEQVNNDGTKVYTPGAVYVSGDIVLYNGKKYAAKWWTTSTPGSDESWRVVA
ncbi:MAG: immunoglobulin-like domain-containing protein, partial [Bacilli bacterium]